MFERVKHMLIKEFIQVFRDPRMRVVIFLIPCVQVLIIGYAVSTDVKHVRTAVFDLDNSQESRDLTARFVGSGYFDVTARPASDAQVRYLLDHGDVSAVLRFNHGFAEDLNAGRTARLQVFIDGTDSNMAAIVASYAIKITTAYSDQILVERVERAFGPAGKTGTFDLRTRAWFNENLESRNFYVPGVLVIVVALSTLLLTSMAVVREKEIGTIEQIMVTPITPAEFILGKTLPFGLIGLAEVLLVTAIGVFWFEVPIRGQLAAAVAGTVPVPDQHAGPRAVDLHLQPDAAAGDDVHLPGLLPDDAPFGFRLPGGQHARAGAMADEDRSDLLFSGDRPRHFLKGVGVEILWTQMLPLLAMGMCVFWAAVRRFHKTL